LKKIIIILFYFIWLNNLKKLLSPERQNILFQKFISPPILPIGGAEAIAQPLPPTPSCASENHIFPAFSETIMNKV